MKLKGLLTIPLVALAGCASFTIPLGGGLPTPCGIVSASGGTALGGVTGAFLAGNSVSNNLVTTKKGGKFTTTVTKKNASAGDTALYTLGGALGGAVISGLAANYLCPAASPVVKG